MRKLTGVLKQFLENQGTVSVEGLGVFFRDSGGELRFTPQTAPRVFLAYVREDQLQALRLCADLRARGADPWLDCERLMPGQNWPRCIEDAIEVADYFVPLFSRRSVTKRSQFHSELRYALECANRQPLEESFVVPVRLDDCRLPERITDTVQYVDLFPNWEAGIDELAVALQAVH